MKKDEDIQIFLDTFQKLYTEGFEKIAEAEKMLAEFRKTSTIEDLENLTRLSMERLRSLVEKNPTADKTNLLSTLDNILKSYGPKKEEMN